MTQNPRAFVVSPIGPPDSDSRKQSDRLLKWIVEPVCGALNLAVERADQMATPGRITNQIAEQLATADLVVADLTGLNANVMYEIGVRHGLGLPIVQLAEEGTSLPFDLVDVRTVFYKLDLDHVEAAKAHLQKQVTEALAGKGRPFSDLRPTQPPDGDSASPDRDRALLGAIADTAQAIARGVEESRAEARQYAETIFAAVKSLESTKNAEVGAQLFAQIVGQGIQNPNGLREFAKVMDTWGEKAKDEASKNAKKNRPR